jgi:hypothetical protein
MLLRRHLMNVPSPPDRACLSRSLDEQAREVPTRMHPWGGASGVEAGGRRRRPNEEGAPHPGPLLRPDLRRRRAREQTKSRNGRRTAVGSGGAFRVLLKNR